MSAEPINSWDAVALVAGESTFGTTPNPAAAQACEIISIKTGGSEEGATRGKRDRGLGREMQNGFVRGRVQPGQFSIITSWKSRPDADDAYAVMDTILAAAGLYKTTNSGVSVTYTPVADPQSTGTLIPMSIFRATGKGLYASFAEQMRGCVVKTVKISGGDKEVECEASGDWAGKYTLGKVDSVTLANNSVTSITLTAEESYRIGPGWYSIESEIIKVTDATYGATSRTIARGELSSTAAAHTAQPMMPYVPADIVFSGSPISEATATFTLDSVALEVQSWQATFTSGIDLRAGATGSAYTQGTKLLRTDLTITAKVMLRREHLSLVGKSNTGKTVVCSIVQGTGAGGIFTLAASYCEVMAFEVPDNENDIVIADISLRCRGNVAGNNLFTITLT